MIQKQESLTTGRQQRMPTSKHIGTIELFLCQLCKGNNADKHQTFLDQDLPEKRTNRRRFGCFWSCKNSTIFLSASFRSKWKAASSQVSLHILQVSDSPSGATAARAACPRKPEGLTLVAVVQKDTQYCMRLMRLNLCFRDDILLLVTPIAECMYFLAQKDVVIVVLRMALRP